MSRRCELTGVHPLSGNKVSHANNKTRRRQLPNLQKKRYFISELGRTVTLTLSTRAIRSVERWGGIEAAIRQAGADTVSPRVLRLQRDLQQ